MVNFQIQFFGRFSKLLDVRIFLREKKFNMEINLFYSTFFWHAMKELFQIFAPTKRFCTNRVFQKKRKISGYWDDVINVHKFMKEFASKFNVNTQEDWDKITQTQIKKAGGSTLLNKYSIYDLKCFGFPDGKDFFSKLKKTPKNYWNNKQNLENLISKIKQQLNLKSAEDWNLITQKQIREFSRSKLVQEYSVFEIKCMACPEGKNIFTKPQNYWKKKENVIQFLNELKLQKNLITTDDWNTLSQKDIIQYGGESLLNKYSLYELKSMGNPDGNLIYSKPSRKSIGYWNSIENVQLFLQELRENLNLKTKEDWNSISRSIIIKFGGASLLKYYSMYDIKALGFPEGKDFFLQEPKQKPPGYWKDKKNVQNFLENLQNKYDLQSPDDWNSISQSQIKSLGGSHLFTFYTLSELKFIACPGCEPVLINQRKPHGYWNSENAQKFLIDMKLKFGIRHASEWQRISNEQIKNFGGGGLLAKFSKKFINENLLDINQRSNSLNFRSSQRWLFLQIQQLFPDEEIVEDFYHSELSRKTGTTVQFDIFLLKSNIAFEYHGKQHYEDIPAFAPVELYNIRDKEKRDICKQFNIQLIVIPYWWDNTIESLRTQIKTELPNELSIIVQ